LLEEIFKNEIDAFVSQKEIGQVLSIMGLPFYNQSCENDFKEKFSELILT